MNQSTEEKILKSSMFVLLIFAVSGVVFGNLLNSEVILFEGIYSTLSIVTSYLTLRVTRYIRKKDDDNFPFGKEGIIPLVVLLQFLILNAMLIYMFVDAILIILSGGSVTNLGSVIVYLLFTTTLVSIYCKRLKKASKTSQSPIILSEVKQWHVTQKQGYFVLGGYILGFVLSQTSTQGITPYIDPIILIIFTILTISQTFNEMIKAFKELIGMSTIGDKTYEVMEDKIDKISDEFRIKDYYLRVKHLGGMLVMEIDFLVDHQFECETVKDQDRIRDEVYRTIHKNNLNLWLSISFTTDPRWIE
ncbi:hypothetical protein AOC36_02795 [Erysipelothrix larvae]|uniref:Cation efflux protein transmembrane domain-containing protein n=1 Tax=Erysipelothrix larvae TaxID=1514105 RepID=A0A0X8GYV5_9FIRM|nr:cation transporter [Erysipelothrix larvae]AMC92949.1 hypothetical protein AOC36_02795 [Erysipelothrix larvae]